MNLDGMDPDTEGLFVDKFVGRFWESIWDPLFDDNEGETSGDTILSCFVLVSLELSWRLVLEEIIAELELAKAPCRVDSCMPDRGGRWDKEKLFCDDVRWEPTLRIGR